MANGFFCFEHCRNPDCAGCDPDKVPIGYLKTWIRQAEEGLDVLYRALERRP